jgi:glycosyltransferase involved in cell wall biosynthesis
MGKRSVIIPTHNEAKRISQIVARVRQMDATAEIVVVDNGSRDGTAAIARQLRCRVKRFEHPLGHDVGRAVGAALAAGDVCLFLDGDMVLEVVDMRAFVEAIESGVDVALNGYLGKVEKNPVHNVVLAKHAFQAFVGQAHRKGVSLTTIPHALSRKAIETIGYASLMVPPLALAMAYEKGLRVEAVRSIDVGALNPKKRVKVAGKDPLEGVILGDHLEALAAWLDVHGERGGFPDGIRRRAAVSEDVSG